MTDIWSRMWEEIAARPSGPMAFRFYIQPLVATILAVRDGMRDAHAGRPAFLWSLFKLPEQRRELLASWWRSAGKVFIIAIVLDIVYQIIALKGLRPIAGLVVAVLLAIVPYALFRGPTTRISRRIGQIRRRRQAHA